MYRGQFLCYGSVALGQKSFEWIHVDSSLFPLPMTFRILIRRAIRPYTTRS